MTEIFAKGDPALVKKRYAAERRFQAYGLAALAVTAIFLGLLVIDIVGKAMPAFTESRVQLTVKVDPAQVDATSLASANFEGLVKESLRGLFPAVTSKADRRKLTGLVSQGGADELRRQVLADPKLIGTAVSVPVLLSDDADLYLKGAVMRTLTTPGKGAIQLAQAGEDVSITGDVAGLAAGNVVAVNGGALRVRSIEGGAAQAEVLMQPRSLDAAPDGTWSSLAFPVAEADRRITDREVVWLEALKAQGSVERRFAWRFFTSGDSREPELAGIRGALVGSLFTVAVTLLLALPIGVAAALYLEEFAPKNRWTDLIEININNLAAVPSIIFGLLGLAIFLNAFGFPRSAPLVGGLVLALLVLPTIIIASRAAIRSVPPSIKEAALGVGASHLQAVTDHVLPLAVPGILTGTILGVARALGETAPLLMIGMVAFIVDVPQGVTEAATVLPVQIFLWSDLPEAAFQSKTAAAIVLLLFVLFFLNSIAIYLRKRYERRW